MVFCTTKTVIFTAVVANGPKLLGELFRSAVTLPGLNALRKSSQTLFIVYKSLGHSCTFICFLLVNPSGALSNWTPECLSMTTDEMKHPDPVYFIKTLLVKSTAFSFGLCHQHMDLKLCQTSRYHVITNEKLTYYVPTLVQMTNATAVTTSDVPKGSQHKSSFLESWGIREKRKTEFLHPLSVKGWCE